VSKVNNKATVGGQERLDIGPIEQNIRESIAKHDWST
jgi:hypothetical protein